MHVASIDVRQRKPVPVWIVQVTVNIVSQYCGERAIVLLHLLIRLWLEN